MLFLVFYSGKVVSNSITGKNMCPIPTCTTTKGRVKSRLRHLPKKWTTLSKDSKEAISKELRKFKRMTPILYKGNTFVNLSVHRNSPQHQEVLPGLLHADHAQDRSVLWRQQLSGGHRQLLFGRAEGDCLGCSRRCGGCSGGREQRLLERGGPRADEELPKVPGPKLAGGSGQDGWRAHAGAVQEVLLRQPEEAESGQDRAGVQARQPGRRPAAHALH